MGDPWWVERSCGRCGRATDADSGALVLYGPHDSTTHDVAALCPHCAAILTPFRFAVDIGRIRAVATRDAIGREVGELIEHVLVMRAEPPTDVVWTRARDTHVLARRLATTRTHLAMRLRDLGALAAIDVATRDRLGGAGRMRRATRAAV